jgi:hypothetical protein
MGITYSDSDSTDKTADVHNGNLSRARRPVIISIFGSIKSYREIYWKMTPNVVHKAEAMRLGFRPSKQYN